MLRQILNEIVPNLDVFDVLIIIHDRVHLLIQNKTHIKSLHDAFCNLAPG